LYACKLGLTLREEQRFRVFQNRVLKRIFGPKREEVAGGWKSPHNEELRNLYALPDIVRMIKSRGDEMGGARSTHRREEKRIRSFGRKT
jgi:hypothetical protein